MVSSSFTKNPERRAIVVWSFSAHTDSKGGKEDREETNTGRREKESARKWQKGTRRATPWSPTTVTGKGSEVWTCSLVTDAGGERGVKNQETPKEEKQKRDCLQESLLYFPRARNHPTRVGGRGEARNYGSVSLSGPTTPTTDVEPCGLFPTSQPAEERSTPPPPSSILLFFSFFFPQRTIG